MFAMACIDRQNEINKQKREKAQAIARKEAVKEKKKKLKAMQQDGSLQILVQALRERGKCGMMSCLFINNYVVQ